jgi:hypothetical protein
MRGRKSTSGPRDMAGRLRYVVSCRCGREMNKWSFCCCVCQSQGHRPPPEWQRRASARDRCACGREKWKKARRCQHCYEAIRRKYDGRPCACGNKKSPTARQCFECRMRDDDARRSRVCEECSQPFNRPRHGNRDAQRFCSRSCGFAWQKREGAEKRKATAKERETQNRMRDVERTIQRELAHAIRTRLDQVVPRRPLGSFKTAERVRHVCPDCGVAFDGVLGRVFCSPKCCQRYLHKRKYPALAHIEVHERNQLASMLALVRAANRQLQGVSYGSR